MERAIFRHPKTLSIAAPVIPPAVCKRAGKKPLQPSGQRGFRMPIFTYTARRAS